jgi:hypothetical protein
MFYLEQALRSVVAASAAGSLADRCMHFSAAQAWRKLAQIPLMGMAVKDESVGEREPSRTKA